MNINRFEGAVYTATLAAMTAASIFMIKRTRLAVTYVPPSSGAGPPSVFQVDPQYRSHVLNALDDMGLYSLNIAFATRNERRKDLPWLGAPSANE